MNSKKLYFWQAILVVCIIPIIVLLPVVLCVNSPEVSSIFYRKNYANIAFNLVFWGTIIFALTRYYKLPLISEGWKGVVKRPRGQLALLCLVGVLDVLFFESFIALTGGRQELKLSLPHLLSAVIVAPIVEETLDRHVLLRLFLRTYRTPAIAILYSAILFTLLHGEILIKPILIVPYLTSGIVLGYLYYKSHSLWFCILMHSFQNIMSYIFLAIFY